MRAGWRKVLVWDLPIRLFHWLTVALVAALYITERLNWMDWHVWAGEVLLALVIFRLIWGVVGSDTARFSRFVCRPAAAMRHLGRVFRGEAHPGVGHNAAGGWMVLFLLALLLIQCLTGVYDNNDVANEGDLTEIVPAHVSDAIADAHAWVWDVLVAAIVFHVLAIAAYEIVKRDKLLLPMITGRKRLPETVRAPRMARLWLAGVVMLISAGIAAAISTYL